MVEPIAPGASLWQLVQGLGFCIGIFLVGVWAYKKVVLKGGVAPGQARKIKVIERYPLSPRSGLVLVNIDSKQILIATNGDGVSMLQISDPVIDLQEIEKEYAKAV